MHVPLFGLLLSTCEAPSQTSLHSSVGQGCHPQSVSDPALYYPDKYMPLTPHCAPMIPLSVGCCVVPHLARIFFLVVAVSEAVSPLEPWQHKADFFSPLCGAPFEAKHAMTTAIRRQSRT